MKNEGIALKIWMALLISGIVVISCRERKVNIEMDQNESLIRMERLRSNEAIAKKDTVTLASIWTEDYHVITSRNFEASGRIANRERFANEFTTRPDVIYIRTTEKVDVFEQWNMAAETGTWVGHWTDKESLINVSGTYYAKWHKVNGQWMIRAEVFVPLKCEGGAICNDSPI